MTNVTFYQKLDKKRIAVEATMESIDDVAEIQNITVQEIFNGNGIERRGCQIDITDLFEVMTDQQITEHFNIDWCEVYAEHEASYNEYLNEV